MKVWPAGISETFCTDSFRCRFMSEASVDAGRLLDVQKRIVGAGIDIAGTQMLRTFDKQPGFTLAVTLAVATAPAAQTKKNEMSPRRKFQPLSLKSR